MIKKPTRTQNIWLNTTDSLVDSERKIFTFNDMPLIQVRNHSVLKINSVTLSGTGVSSASAHNWTIKLNNVKYNTTSYFSSDNNSDPTIAMINYDTNNSIQTGSFALELEPSDIKQLVIKVKADDGHGLLKNSQNIDMHIGLTICEYDE
tara:strand:- start:683 stop:1129 length:447 start_codon:yes stop_codon:yes gene_type:complete